MVSGVLRELRGDELPAKAGDVKWFNGCPAYAGWSDGELCWLVVTHADGRRVIGYELTKPQLKKLGIIN